MHSAEQTLDDLVFDQLRRYWAATGEGPFGELFAERLFALAFRWPLEDVAASAARPSPLPELDQPPWRSPLQERVRQAVAASVRWWWPDDPLAELRADAAGRAVADLIQPWMAVDAAATAKRGPQPKLPAMPSEMAAAYDAERRWRETH